MTFKQGELYALADEHQKALRELRRAVDQGFFCPPCLERSPLLEPLREEPAFVSAAAAARARHHDFGRRFGL